MVGRPKGTTKNPNRRRVQNPSGRLIDFEGNQYNKLLKNGYKLNPEGTKLVVDETFTGDRNAPSRRGRPPKNEDRNVPPKTNEKIRNPDTGRQILKRGTVFKQLSKKYQYDEKRNKFRTTVFDPKTNKRIHLKSERFKTRIKNGYIYDEVNNTLDSASEIKTSAFKNAICEHDMKVVTSKELDQMKRLESRIKYLIERRLNKSGPISIMTSMDITFSKPSPTNENEFIFINANIHVEAEKVNNKGDIKNTVRHQNSKLSRRIDRFTRNGSGWTVHEITRHYITFFNYNPLAARSYIALPSWIQNKKATINIKNEDDKCFVYCLARVLDPHPEKKNLERVSKHLKRVINELKLDEIKTPVSMRDIPDIEKKYNISINVYGHNSEDFSVIRTTKQKFNKHVDLLYTEREGKQHYVLIKDFDRLNLRKTKGNNKIYHCRYCLRHFTRQGLLDKHIEDCIVINGGQAIEMPKEGENNLLNFRNIKNCLSCPFVIYADIEAILKPLKQQSERKNETWTIKTHEHEACSFGYKVVCHDNEELSKPFKMFRGRNAIPKFFEAIFEEEKEIIEHMKRFKKNTDIIMTKEQCEEYEKAHKCYICEGKFTKDNIKVRDHNHINNLYRGAAHNKCNLQLRLSYKIPIIFHNLKGYDSHHLMQHIGLFKKKISVIANNMEKYLSFSIGTERKEWDDKEKKMVNKIRENLTFIDSFQFMSSSLEKLTENLRKSGSMEEFKHAKKEFNELTDLMIRKGVYPYSYMTGYKKFNINPRKLKLQDFKNDLTGDCISEENYKHYLNVCDKFQIKTLGDYHDLYLKSDVLLLADVFENFRKTCLKNYGLDPCHYVSSPGLAWDSCLKMTKIQLELFTDVNMHLFIEKGSRGGVSIITHRKGVANNKYMKNYDENKPSKFISYLDANNLYGWAMSQSMPYGGFKWLTKKKINKFVLRDYSELCSNNLPKGYILEVDLDYPEELHDLHNEYPYCPEHVIINEDMLSPYSKHIAEENNLKLSDCSKLLQTLGDQKKYVIHERNLRQALDAGLVLRKIHRILEFNQKPWMKDYIDFNTNKRKEAKNDFEKDFFKLMNNSVFGKTMENVRNRQDIRLVTDMKELIKQTSKPTFIGGKIFNEDLAAIHCIRAKIKLNKPVFVGFSILDISKTLMYDFHYKFIKTKYGSNAKLLFTDTDSLCYEIKTKDIYKDMFQNREYFDLSDITNEKFHDDSNKKVIGKFKPEYPNNIIEEVIGLRSKMYSIKFHDKKELKRAKGIVRSVCEKELTHDKYSNILNTGRQMHSMMNVIRSQKHRMYTMKMSKVSLSAFDDKRFLRQDGIRSYAYRHYKTQT
jgi:hypothetical protein